MILLIGGTSETAPLATGLARAGYAVLVSTATGTPLETGAHPRIFRRAGPLDEAGLVALGREMGLRAIVDGAHPYAVAAHAAARQAAGHLGIPFLVFRRPPALAFQSVEPPGKASSSDAPPDRPGELPVLPAGNTADPAKTGRPSDAVKTSIPDDPILFAADHAEAARMAFADGRPVLLTTGSRNLAPYAEAARKSGIPLAARVLCAPGSLAACREAAIPDERVISGRGPFSVAENLAAIRRFSIGVIVSKESGRAGGLDAKLAAATQARCRLIVIRRPEPPAGAPVFDEPALLIAALKDLVPPAFEPSGR